MAKNVLIVDDCDATRTMLMRGVREAAGTTDLAATGGAVEGLKAPAGAAFDLILCDLGAPGSPPAPAPAATFRPFLK